MPSESSSLSGDRIPAPFLRRLLAFAIDVALVALAHFALIGGSLSIDLRLAATAILFVL